jgi:aspartyl/asparaginyl-tRNA synthetase
MSLHAHAHQVENSDGLTLTKLTLVEQIYEMNGVEVEQSTAMQQVFEITATEVTAHEPCQAMSLPREMQATHDARKARQLHHHSKMATRTRKMQAWLKVYSPHF